MAHKITITFKCDECGCEEYRLHNDGSGIDIVCASCLEPEPFGCSP